MPELSVVIACYDANATLGVQLESLAAQVDPPEFEVLVVDNASPVSPASVVAEWENLLDVRIVRADAAQGVAYARNVGIAHARASRIAFCDADDVTGPGFLRAAHDALDRAPFITGSVHTVAAEEFDAGLVHVRSLVADRPSGLQAEFVPVDADYPVFMGGASAVDKNAALAIGGFDQSYVPGAEDNDFGLRARAAGYEVLRCASMTLAERRRATASGALRRSFAGGRMHMRLCAGHDLWTTSPHLNHPRWWVDLARLPIAGLKVLARGNSAEDRLGYAGRCGLRAGQLAGYLTYAVARRPIVTQIGLGLD